jgi:hypothetical protein
MSTSVVTKPSKAEVKESMKRILTELVSCGVIGTSCVRAGVPVSTHKLWLQKYPAYAQRFAEIKERFVDGLESVAIARAKEKSDMLLAMMLKAHRREVYGDRSQLELQANLDKPPIQIVFAEGMLTPSEKEMLGQGGPPAEVVYEATGGEVK